MPCPVRSYLQSQALRPILSRYRTAIHTRSCTDAKALRFLTRIRSLMCRSMPRRAIGAVVHIVQLFIEVLTFDKNQSNSRSARQQAILVRRQCVILTEVRASYAFLSLRAHSNSHVDSISACFYVVCSAAQYCDPNFHCLLRA